MAKPERMVNDYGEILSILRDCDSITLGLSDGEWPYTVEMNFGFVDDNGKCTIYLHTSHDGKKLAYFTENARVAFSASCDHHVLPGKVPCAYTFQYRSAAGKGLLHKVTDTDEKIAALKAITGHYIENDDYPFDARHTLAVELFRIDVCEMTGKKRITK